MSCRSSDISRLIFVWCFVLTMMNGSAIRDSLVNLKSLLFLATRLRYITAWERSSCRWRFFSFTEFSSAFLRRYHTCVQYVLRWGTEDAVIHAKVKKMRTVGGHMRTFNNSRSCWAFEGRPFQTIDFLFLVITFIAIKTFNAS